ncbi:MAG: DUF1993 domain-containing protein [Nevskia sp.]|nr:DUF1993 domain-containing protein [Nevskia sp.]
MTISMYQASVPVFTRALTALRAILQKGAAHAEARKLDEKILTGSRLFPDMFPLSRQVQIATDQAKGGTARLAGVEVPKYEDTETTFAELIARIDKTLAFIKTVKPEQIDGSEQRQISLPTPVRTLEFKGQDYLLFFVIPNLHFHCTTTYALLRHNGVEVGKLDYLAL